MGRQKGIWGAKKACVGAIKAYVGCQKGLWVSKRHVGIKRMALRLTVSYSDN